MIQIHSTYFRSLFWFSWRFIIRPMALCGTVHFQGHLSHFSTFSQIVFELWLQSMQGSNQEYAFLGTCQSLLLNHMQRLCRNDCKWIIWVTQRKLSEIFVLTDFEWHERTSILYLLNNIKSVHSFMSFGYRSATAAPRALAGRFPH